MVGLPHRARERCRRDLVLDAAWHTQSVLTDRLAARSVNPVALSALQPSTRSLTALGGHGRSSPSLFRFTNLGLQLRASALAPEVSRLLGVRVESNAHPRLDSLDGRRDDLPPCSSRPNFFSGLTPAVMDGIFAFGFIAAAIGGLESPVGAIVAGVVLGHRLAVRRRLHELERDHHHRARHSHRLADGATERRLHQERREASLMKLRLRRPSIAAVAMRSAVDQRPSLAVPSASTTRWCGDRSPSTGRRVRPTLTVPDLRARHPVVARAALTVLRLDVALFVDVVLLVRSPTSTSRPARRWPSCCSASRS